MDDPAPGYGELEELTEPKRVKGRSSAGFHPARREDVQLFAAVLDGDGVAQGFANKTIRSRLYGEARGQAICTPGSGGESAVEAVTRSRSGGENTTTASLASDVQGQKSVEQGRRSV